MTALPAGSPSISTSSSFHSSRSRASTNSATNRAGWSSGNNSSRDGGNSQACSRLISRSGTFSTPLPAFPLSVHPDIPPTYETGSKGRVERTAGTFQDRLITELRLAGATTVAQAKAVLQQFLPRFNRRFGVPAQCPEPAFRPMDPESRLGQMLCFKHRRRVARDNTVKYYRHTLQLLPSQQRRSYAAASVVVLEGLDGRLSLQHEGRIIASQEAPPSPSSLRSRNGTSPPAAIPIPDPRSRTRTPRQNLRLQISICWAQSQIKKKVPTPRQSTMRR